MIRRIRARFLFVGAGLLAAGACVAILSLIPALISIRIARAAVEASPTAPVEGNISEEQAAAVRAQALIGSLRPLATATTSPTTALAIALAQKPANASITTITYKTGAGGELVLSGTAAERDAVNVFRSALEGTGRFSRVAVPVAALVGTQEGRFTVTLSGIF